MGAGKHFPRWVANEGSDNDCAVSCGRFFAEISVDKGPLSPECFKRIWHGLGAVLRNMVRKSSTVSIGKGNKAVTGLKQLPPTKEHLEGFTWCADIFQEAFCQLAAMTTVNLKSRKLAYIPPFAFYGLSNLREIQL